jgi:KDO2-lipid IV(A) lauroyltransferase
VKVVATPEFSIVEAAPPNSRGAKGWVQKLGGWVRHHAGDAWLNLLFWHARRHPLFVERSKPLWMWGAWTFAKVVRENTLCNARRILGRRSSAAEREALAFGVVSNFYDFVSDIGRSIGQSRSQLLERIERVAGDEIYQSARRDRKGAIVLTAHMGSFEVGMAALLQHEKRVHVLFRRDLLGLFERTRSALRRQLGVVEQCVDEGLAVWVRLREALAADEVVLIQGDRVMPGQKGEVLPFLDGHMLFPTGPVKLAMASGAPIIPIFSIRQPDGQIRLFIEPPVHLSESEGAAGAMDRIRSVLEKYVRQYPDQWLMIHRAWREDRPMGPG